MGGGWDGDRGGVGRMGYRVRAAFALLRLLTFILVAVVVYTTLIIRTLFLLHVSFAAAAAAAAITGAMLVLTAALWLYDIYRAFAYWYCGDAETATIRCASGRDEVRSRTASTTPISPPHAEDLTSRRPFRKAVTASGIRGASHRGKLYSELCQDELGLYSMVCILLIGFRASHKMS